MKSFTSGRSSTNDVVINDMVVSSVHARLTVSDSGEVYIEDLESKNGTIVDGKRIKKAKLSSSSIVLLGNHAIDWKQIIQSAKSKPVKPSVVIPSNVVEKKMIGRNAMSQIRFSFDDVSDTHAFLCKQPDGKILLIDNNSTNGTYVNGSKIIAPYVLTKGDTVSISNRHPLNWEAVYPAKPEFNFKEYDEKVNHIICDPADIDYALCSELTAYRFAWRNRQVHCRKIWYQRTGVVGCQSRREQLIYCSWK